MAAVASGAGQRFLAAAALAAAIAAAAPAERGMAADGPAFALELYAALRGETGNLFFSPASIHAALAMTYGGARGETALHMAAVLHLPADREAAAAAYAALAADLQSRAAGPSCELAIANALWGQRDHAFLPDFLALCAERYGAPLHLADFAGDTEGSRLAINAWVAGQTRDRIDELLRAGDLDARSRLVLVNAIFFKGDWERQFDPERTREQPFHLAGGGEAAVPMMRQTASFPFHEEPGLQALELPYAGGALGMLILLPAEPDGLPALEAALTPERLARIAAGLRERELAVSLPRWEQNSRFELARVLAAMGMPAAFGAEADFSGMDGERGLTISDVIHEAVLTVNEEGSEAAAATGVVMRTSSLPPAFIADRPFLFMIRDRAGRSLLFLGRVADPTAG